MTPRRDVLLGLAAPAVAAPFATAGELPGDDAELMRLWDRYHVLMVESADLFEEDFDPYSDAMAEIEEQAEGMMATTLAGVGVLLRLGLMADFSDDLFRHYLDEEREAKPPSGMSLLVWQALLSLDRVCGVSSGNLAPEPERLT